MTHTIERIFKGEENTPTKIYEWMKSIPHYISSYDYYVCPEFCGTKVRVKYEDGVDDETYFPRPESFGIKNNK
jgi:hypothetical protein